MISHRFSVLVTTWVSCLGVYLSYTPPSALAVQISNAKTDPSIILIAQGNNKTILRLNSEGEEVKRLQGQLKKLGFFPTEITGVYDQQTREAVASFQTSQGLNSNGIANFSVQERLTIIVFNLFMNEGYQATDNKKYRTALQKFRQALAQRPQNFYAQQAVKNIEKYIEAQTANKEAPTNQNQQQQPQQPQQAPQTQDNDWLLFILALMALILIVVFIIYILSKKTPANIQANYIPKPDDQLPLSFAENKSVLSSDDETQILETETELNQQQPSSAKAIMPQILPQEESQQEPYNNYAGKTETNTKVQADTTPLTKVDMIEELIEDLKIPEPKTRKKAIWELAQRADSRAMKPLVRQMLDADSQERSLILQAISQIATRTLKPMNQALSMSLDDENSEVRQNAIRDITGVYELMIYISHRMAIAASDPDTEVQETARWALKQLNQVRTNPYEPIDDDEI